MHLLETNVLFPLVKYRIIVPVNLKLTLLTFFIFTISELEILTKSFGLRISSKVVVLVT